MEQEFSNPVQIRCRGLWNRGSQRSIPRDYASVLTDFRFTDVPCTREPIELECDCSGFLWWEATEIRRKFDYKRDGESVRYIILDDTGRVYDSGLALPEVPIIGPISGDIVDFSAIQLFNRVYISLHDRNKGLQGRWLYVYDPDLGSTARLAAGDAPGSPDILNPTSWYAADAITWLNDGDKVPVWYDLTQGNRDLSQITVANQPVWRGNSLNGRPTVQFEADDKFRGSHTFADILGIDSNLGYGTIFIVFKPETGTDEFSEVFESLSLTRGISLRVSTTELKALAYDGSIDTAAKNTLTLDAWHIAAWMYDGTNVSIALDDQDAAALTSTASGSQTNLGGVDYIELGPFKGHVAEIITFNTALSEENRRRVTQWLKTKYNLTDSTTAPTVFTLAESATAGKTEIGTHILAISNLTNTGHLTAPGHHTSIVSTGKIINITNIPPGPPSTKRRWIWMSKVLRNWDNNLLNPELFFVKEIGDNTTTALVDTAGINAYDSQLVASADPYQALLPRIPAGVALCDYDGSLVVVGEFDNPAVARISNQGEPEAFSSIDGYVQTALGDGGGIKNAESLDGVLYLFKSYRTFATQRGSVAPSGWSLALVDIGRGAECFSVATILDSISATINHALVVINPAGIWLFNGSYVEPLHYAFEADWNLQVISTGDFTQTTACIDPITKRMFVHVGGRILYHLNFAEGFSRDSIRCSVWSLGDVGQTLSIGCVLLSASLMPSLVYTKADGTDGKKEIRRITFDETFQARELYGSNAPIPWKYISALIPGSEIAIYGHISGLNIYGVLGDGYDGAGNAMLALSDPTVELLADMPLLTQFGGPINSQLHHTPADFTFQHLTLELSQYSLIPSSLQLEKINLFITPESDT